MDHTIAIRKNLHSQKIQDILRAPEQADILHTNHTDYGTLERNRYRGRQNEQYSRNLRWRFFGGYLMTTYSRIDDRDPSSL